MSVHLNSASGYGSTNAVKAVLPINEVAGGMLYKPEINIIFDRICDMNYPKMDQLHDCGDYVTFYGGVEVGPLRAYEYNQTLKSDQISMNGNVRIDICHSDYKSLKFDSTSFPQAVSCWEDVTDENLETMIHDQIIKQTNLLHQRRVIADYMVSVAPKNKGDLAGLGTPTNPLLIQDGEDARHLLMQMRQVLKKSGYYGMNLSNGKEVDGMTQMFVLCPSDLTALVAVDALDNIYNTTAQGASIYGAIPKGNFLGAEVIEYEDDLLRPHQLGPGRLVYPVLFGNKDAYKFTRKLMKATYVKEDTQANSFSEYWKILINSGGKLIYPGAVALAYVEVPFNSYFSKK